MPKHPARSGMELSASRKFYAANRDRALLDLFRDQADIVPGLVLELHAVMA